MFASSYKFRFFKCKLLLLRGRILLWIGLIILRMNLIFILSQNDDFKLIIGIRPYKQKLGKKELAVDIKNTSLQTTLYNSFDKAAFLVRDWVKIQSSLEMIFNLLCGSSIKSLEMLAWLRKNQICPIEFAEYLLENIN